MQSEDDAKEAEVHLANRQEQKEAEATANARLEAVALSKLSTEPVRLDKDAIRAEDSERQRRFAESQEVHNTSAWRLPLSGSEAVRNEELTRFRNDIERRGLSFAASKHACEKSDIRAEARRLGLRIDWDRVRR
jgi:hypothetical protein